LTESIVSRDVSKSARQSCSGIGIQSGQTFHIPTIGHRFVWLSRVHSGIKSFFCHKATERMSCRINESGLTRSDRKKFDLFEIIIRKVNGLTLSPLRILMRDTIFNLACRSNQSQSQTTPRVVDSRPDTRLGLGTID
jgi:hypothetical protein